MQSNDLQLIMKGLKDPSSSKAQSLTFRLQSNGLQPSKKDLQDPSSNMDCSLVVGLKSIGLQQEEFKEIIHLTKLGP